MSRPRRRRAALALGPAVLCLLGAAPGAAPGAAQRGGAADSAHGPLVPAGFGTLRQGDVAVTVQVQGLTVRAIPLDESVIRTLAGDSYRSLHALRETKARQIEAIRRRLGLPAVQAWYAQYFNVQQGEARFDPHDVLIRSAGRDFRPLDAFGLGPGFDQGRLAQGRTAEAIYAFDPAIDLRQPLTVTIAAQASDAWGEILQRLDRERSAIWSRAAARKAPAEHQQEATRAP